MGYVPPDFETWKKMGRPSGSPFVSSEGPVHDFPPRPSDFVGVGPPRVPCGYCGREGPKGEGCMGCGATVEPFPASLPRAMAARQLPTDDLLFPTLGLVALVAWLLLWLI